MGQSIPAQVAYPRRAIIRTIFQAFVGLLSMLPVIVSASGIEQTTAGVAGALAISGAVTKIMALPQVEGWISKYLPWLASTPGGM